MRKRECLIVRCLNCCCPCSGVYLCVTILLDRQRKLYLWNCDVNSCDFLVPGVLLFICLFIYLYEGEHRFDIICVLSVFLQCELIVSMIGLLQRERYINCLISKLSCTWGMIHNKIYCISPVCPCPVGGLTMQKRWPKTPFLHPCTRAWFLTKFISLAQVTPSLV